MSVDAVKATIRDGIRAAEQCHATMDRAHAQATEGTALARNVTQGSNHSEVASALALATEAVHEIELVRRRLNNCIDGARDYLTALG